MYDDIQAHRRMALPSQPWCGAMVIGGSDAQRNRSAVTNTPVFYWKDLHADTISINCARVVHKKSRFVEHPFITVSCQTYPRSSRKKAMGQLELLGSFETMEVSTEIDMKLCVPEGTLFMDEVTSLPGELSRGMLALIDHNGLIRFVRTNGQEIEVRMISASTIELRNTRNKQRGHSDLFFQLNIFALHFPSRIVMNEC